MLKKKCSQVSSERGENKSHTKMTTTSTVAESSGAKPKRNITHNEIRAKKQKYVKFYKLFSIYEIFKKYKFQKQEGSLVNRGRKNGIFLYQKNHVQKTMRT